MRQKLFHVMAGLSLLLCVAAAGFWVRSYWRLDGLSHFDKSISDVRIDSVSCGSGTVALVHLVLTPTTTESNVLSSRFPRWRASADPNPKVSMGRALSETRTEGFERAGLGWRHGQKTWNLGTMSDERVLFLPCWLLVLVFAVLPVSWCRSELRRRRRAKLGHCPKCGYDLRATRDRCPECGAIPAAPATAA
jgi:hypothetical protein